MSEWIKWDGGECPVEPGKIIDVEMRDGQTFRWLHSEGLCWKHNGGTADILAYLVVKPEPADKPEPATKPADGITAVLTERGNRYGPFVGHAEVTQRLKNVIGAALRQRDKELTDDQQEALDMICHKIGRIVNGDPNYDDSWVDIAGYAKLVADRLQGVTR